MAGGGGEEELPKHTSLLPYPTPQIQITVPPFAVMTLLF